MDYKLVMIILILVILIYLLLRLHYLEELLKHYHFKNDEGVCSLSRTKNLLYLLMAMITFLPNLINWIANGFEAIDIVRLIPVVVFLWLYYCGDDDE
ncbi:TPA: hypothetical protein ACGPNO_000020 [Streptococcus agalactiae]